MYSENSNIGIFIEKQIRVPSFVMSYEHCHTCCEIFYLKTGSCIYHINNKKYHLVAGDMILVAPNASHSTCYEGLIPCERYVLYFDIKCILTDFQKRFPAFYHSLTKTCKIIIKKDGISFIEHLFKQLLCETHLPDEYSYDFLQIALSQLLISLKRYGIFLYEKLEKNEKIGSDIEIALKFISLNYAAPISLEDIAKISCLSPTYLSKKFKRTTGKNFKEYLNYIRLKHSCQELLTTNNNITKIAANCGFNSSNYFKDIFKKTYGISPKSFRTYSKSTINNSYLLGELNIPQE